jgi:hypothetical protein
MTDLDSYLWDKSNTPDPEIVALERALAPFAEPVLTSTRGVESRPRSRARRSPPPYAWVAGALGLAACLGAVLLWTRAPSAVVEPAPDSFEGKPKEAPFDQKRGAAAVDLEAVDASEPSPSGSVDDRQSLGGAPVPSLPAPDAPRGAVIDPFKHPVSTPRKGAVIDPFKHPAPPPRKGALVDPFKKPVPPAPKGAAKAPF